MWLYPTTGILEFELLRATQNTIKIFTTQSRKEFPEWLDKFSPNDHFTNRSMWFQKVMSVSITCLLVFGIFCCLLSPFDVSLMRQWVNRVYQFVSCLSFLIVYTMEYDLNCLAQFCRHTALHTAWGFFLFRETKNLISDHIRETEKINMNEPNWSR